MNRLPKPIEMQRALFQRDRAYDGIFLAAVKTTGIFCRPSCSARKPLPKNIEYFGSVREALRSGYRPCRRCRPLEAVGEPPSWFRRLMTEVEREPTRRLRDADLRAISIDPSSARRYFSRQYGLTFQAFCRGLRMSQALHDIRRHLRLTDVAADRGYESVSGFRDAFRRTFGKAPGRGRDAVCLLTSTVDSPLGPLLIGAIDQGVCLLEFTDRRALEAELADLRRRFDCAALPGRNEHTDRLKDELAAYFDGRAKRFETPVVAPGTPFQQKVWRALRDIPYGQTRSYEALARAIGASEAQRAVGRANGQNRVAIVIPCHRVVNKDGKLGGYGGGVWRKQFLLDLERGQQRGLA